MRDDEFEWDDLKARSNLLDHKISFRIAQRVFDDQFVLIVEDDSDDYDETRYVATGMIDGILISVVFTERGKRFPERGKRIRIIAARKAESHEQRSSHRR